MELGGGEPRPGSLFTAGPWACLESEASSVKSLVPHPWDSPDKNTGVGCHFLLQCMKVKSEREVTQSCPTLSDPMDCSLPGSSVHRILQASVLEWGAIAFSILSRDSTFILYLAVSTICCVVTDIHLLNLPVENKLHDSRILACFVQHYIPRVVPHTW